MEKLSLSQQTIFQFMEAPFELPVDMKKKFEYEGRYQKFRKENKIKLHAAIEYEDSWFVHIKVPSESTAGNSEYDVVIQFFPPDEREKKNVHIKGYYVQFFSNSPGFVYNYATLYQIQGYLIESLYTKLGNRVLENLPDKSNSKYKLSYDSSIFYACRFMIDHKLTHFGKLYLKVAAGNPSIDRFLRDIQSFEESEASRDIGRLKREVQSELRREAKLSHTDETKIKNSGGKLADDLYHKRMGKKTPVRSTLQDKDHPGVRVIHSSKPVVANAIRTHKKKARKTTVKPK